ncbi:MAG: sigma-70 family RNA polymerase sigma factor [Ruminococcaceae bacterium]|nr:sigma-70 family RNA polymerase sigma factor [Oscillospiraceae bacterium]
MISIGTIGLIKGISTYNEAKGTRLATYAARCVENEILMYFRSQKKSSSDVSLSEYIETGKDGGALSLMDVVCTEEDLFEDISNRQLHDQLRDLMRRCLTEREEQILRLRYGIDLPHPLPQREVAKQCGISRSYVSRIEKKALEKLQTELNRGL